MCSTKCLWIHLCTRLLCRTCPQRRVLPSLPPIALPRTTKTLYEASLSLSLSLSPPPFLPSDFVSASAFSATPPPAPPPPPSSSPLPPPLPPPISSPFSSSLSLLLLFLLLVPICCPPLRLSLLLSLPLYLLCRAPPSLSHRFFATFRWRLPFVHCPSPPPFPPFSFNLDHASQARQRR